MPAGGLDACIQPDDSAPAGFTLAALPQFSPSGGTALLHGAGALNGDTSIADARPRVVAVTGDYDNTQIRQLADAAYQPVAAS